MPSDVLMNRHMAKLGMAAQPVSWSDGSLTLHEVAQFFSVPIAEAAQKLSVCGSVLQRICKENGIARWPYRKVTAGKSIEEIIEEGIKELATNPGAYKTAEKQPEKTSGSPTTTVAFIPNGPDVLGQPSPKRLARQQEAGTIRPSQVQKSTQRTVSAAQPRTPGQGNNITPPQMVNQQPHVNNNNNNNIPLAAAPTSLKLKPASTIDDFKIGFPSKGLRRASTRWWGSFEKEPATTATSASTTTAAVAAEERGTELVCPENSEEGLDCASEEVGLTTASSLLVRTRKKASLRGRSSTAHAVTRGYGLHKLGAKDAATLRFVFGDFLPKHWTSAFPPVP